MRFFAKILPLSLFVLLFCQCQPGDEASCATAKDETYHSQVDALEAKPNQEAIDSLNELIGFLETESSPLSLAYAQYRRGVVDSRRKDLAGAIRWYQKALEGYRSCPDVDPSRIAMLYKNIADKYFHLDQQYRQAHEWALRGLTYVESLPSEQIPFDRYWELYLLAGRSKHWLGDPQAAINYFRLARQKIAADSVSYYLVGHMAEEQGMSFYELDQLDSARYYNEQAKAIVLGQKELIIFDSLDLATAYNDAWIIYEAIGEDKQALSNIQKSIAFNADLKDTLKLAKNLNNLGVYYMKRGRVEEAKSNFRKARQLHHDMGNELGLGHTADNLGDCYRAQNRPGEALKWYDQAIQSLWGDTEEQAIDKARFRTDLYEPMVSRARMVAQLNPTSLSPQSPLWQAYAQVDELVQSLRQDFTDENSKFLTQGRIRPVYEEIIQLCYEGWNESQDQFWLDQAVQYFERSKGLVLQEAIHRERSLRGVISDTHYERDRELQRLQHYFYQQSLNSTLTALQRQEYEQRYLQADLELRQLRDSLELLYPQYRSFLSLQQSPSLADIQDRLSEEQHLIDFFVGDRSTYILRISRNAIQFARWEVAQSDVSEKVSAFRQGIEAPFMSVNGNHAEYDSQVRSYGYEFFENLLQPVLSGDVIGQLFLIPDDVLAYLPFEAVLMKPVGNDRSELYHTYPYLVRSFHVNYQLSLGVWRMNQASEAPRSTRGILAVAPEQQDDQMVRLEGRRALQLAHLGYNQDEVEALKGWRGLTVLSGRKASKADFIRRVAEYSIIHFAGHGTADAQQSYRSFLAFDLPRASEQNDELLFLPELYTIPLPAEMVVLSACQTADGRLSKGEGVLSLTRAATLAGAQSVVSSLWLVNQQSKVGLVKAFYAALAQGQRKDEALRTAKLAYLELTDSSWAHPYHWAGMVLVGNPRVMDMWMME